MQEGTAANETKSSSKAHLLFQAKRLKREGKRGFPQTGTERRGQLLHLHAQEVTQPELSDVVGNILVVLEPGVR